MNDVLAGLTPTQAPPTPAPAGAQVDSSSVPPAVDPAEVATQYPFLGAIATGKIPGVVVPKDWRAPATKVITPQVMGALGLVFSKPEDPSLALAIVNPKKVTRKEFDKLDKEGKLDNHFPSIAEFVPSTGDAMTPAANAPVAQAEPGTGAPSQGQVPIVPAPVGPGLGANAQDQIAKARAQNLTLNQVPSARQVPGGGSVLNGLIKRAV